MERFKFFNFKNCWLFESAIFCDFRCIPIRVGSHSGHSFKVAASLTPEIRANTRYALRNDLRAFHFATPNIRNKISINTESVLCIIKIEILRLVPIVLKFNQLSVISELQFCTAECNFITLKVWFLNLHTSSSWFYALIPIREGSHSVRSFEVATPIMPEIWKDTHDALR